MAELVLYSCYTWLAHQINETYYGGNHYVWCTPFFNPSSKFCAANAVPPTSSPFAIYKTLDEEVKQGDRHSAKVAQNKLGIQKGAEMALKTGIIGGGQRDDIVSITDAAALNDFRPLLLVIPYPLVSSQIKQVAIKDRAHPLSQEYIIANLKRDQFDILEFR
jgi:hypothetical protein